MKQEHFTDRHQKQWTLVPITLADLPEFLALLREPSVRLYLCDDTEIPEETVRSFIESSNASFAKFRLGLWFIRDAHELAGVVGLIGDEANEIIYITAPDYRGRGIAVAASRQVFRMAAAAGQGVPIMARIDAPNEASLRIADELGMTYSGVEQNPVTGGNMRVYILDLNDLNPASGMVGVE